MRTPIIMQLIPGLLTTTLFVLACEKAPSPAAPKRAQFSVQDEHNSRITGGGKLDGGRDFATFGFNARDRKSTRLNSSHRCISYAVFCLKNKKLNITPHFLNH